ncbi:Histidinol-phosphate aminotransferase [Candidatus Johnevansia muelleri]|uniref:Histidinol-phosphate aminotransferase n=1 Tax=Candidatus Johnevansia muelleri TaxID=1495769 RepID=A0A078KE24_9GAMM|nr:Histidinol-phosphate aminotransferase [Candidatus Evansia muelleri]
MSKFWSNELNKLKPYVPGEQSNQIIIKLNTNENPYSTTHNVKKVLKNFSIDNLKLYPDPDSKKLKIAIAKKFNINYYEIFLGNGSDEVLALAFLTFFRNNIPIIIPDITYSFYTVYCKLYNIKYKLVPLNNNWEVDLTAMNQKNGGIVFANPNAPTGNAHKKSSIIKLLSDQKEHVILIDEAYVDFGSESTISLIHKYPNLLIIKTLSKSYSLAGIRIGFAIGSKQLIDGLKIIKNSFNSYTINSISSAVALSAIKDEKYFNKNCIAIIYTREKIQFALENRKFELLYSKSNFIFVKPINISAVKLFIKLRKLGILVRYFSNKKLKKFLRISIGTELNMNKFIKNIDYLIIN